MLQYVQMVTNQAGPKQRTLRHKKQITPPLHFPESLTSKGALAASEDQSRDLGVRLKRLRGRAYVLYQTAV